MNKRVEIPHRRDNNFSIFIFYIANDIAFLSIGHLEYSSNSSSRPLVELFNQNHVAFERTVFVLARNKILHPVLGVNKSVVIICFAKHAVERFPLSES